ncbi:unnamed protein product [Rotaria sp. Silwood1]|nr:unnamed protein product [Rotaria sp. Silwood1]
MDFDIDAVLDQLEKTLNQSDHEEKEPNQIIQTSSMPSTSMKTADELLLLELDPLGNPEYHNNNNNQENDDKIERIKQDLQELYASSIVIDTPSMPTSTLPDVIVQQEENLSTSLPFAVEQLEFEVRQEILQHTLDQSSSPDLTTMPNNHHDDTKETGLFSTSSTSTEEGEEEEEEEEEEKPSSPLPVTETAQTSNNLIYQSEPDLIQHETPPVKTPVILHSVDSIVNAPMGTNLDDFITSDPSMNETATLQQSSEIFFIGCNDNDEKSMQSSSEEPIGDNEILSSPMTKLTTAVPTQDFDLVKNILSEIFDKNNEEILDENPIEEKESELVNIEQQEISPPPASLTTSNDEDFRFLDEMLASIDGPDVDIHQLTPAEIDRVDNILKEIVNAHQTETVSSSLSSSLINDIEPCPPPSPPPPPPPPSEQPPSPPTESDLSYAPQSVAAAAEAAASTVVPVDEELIRVEQEWSKLTEEEKTLGSVAPEWVSDDQAPVCMKCSAKFSITRRRHHCRACGKVFCSACCWQKVKLIHDDSKEDRACNDCIKTINNVEYLWNYMRNNQKPRSSVLRKKSGKSLKQTLSSMYI